MEWKGLILYSGIVAIHRAVKKYSCQKSKKEIVVPQSVKITKTIINRLKEWNKKFSNKNNLPFAPFFEVNF